MSEYPSDWTTTQLQEVATDFVVPMRDRPKEFKGSIPWIRIEDFNGKRVSRSQSGLCVNEAIIKEMNLKVHPQGTILCSCSANLGVCAITEIPLITNQTFIGIVPNPSKIDTEYLYYLMCSKASQLQTLSSGTTIAYLPRKKFEEFEVCIPPLPEQKKIAEILSGIDRVINARRNSAEAIAQIGNFTAEELFQRASIACNSVKIGDCTRRLWQGINTAADKVEYHDTGVPILQAKHVTSGRIDPQGSRYLSEEDYNKYKERYQPHAGDILFTNIGTIGKSALVTDRPKFLIAWNIFLISPSEEIISEYLQYFLQSLDRRNYFHEHAAGNATKFINKTLISELEVPLPPKEQQIKVCNQIRAINKAEECDRNAIAKYLELKRSLLIDLLSGRKRVSI